MDGNDYTYLVDCHACHRTSVPAIIVKRHLGGRQVMKCSCCNSTHVSKPKGLSAPSGAYLPRINAFAALVAAMRKDEHER